MIFEGLLGNEPIKKAFAASLKAKRTSHAYLIEGQAGSGRFAFAKHMAAAFVCNRPDPPCLTCVGCQKALKLLHPDIAVIGPEKNKGSITIDQIRRITQSLFILPNEGKNKVYIIKEAHKMTAQAQNALLKAIEEPPPFCVFILTATSREGILPVILSRVTTLATVPVQKEELKGHLMKECGMHEEEALFYASVGGGNVGRAKKLWADNQLSGFVEVFDGCLRGQVGRDNGPLMKGIDFFEGQKEDFDETSELFLLYIRDVAAVKSGYHDLYYTKYQEKIEQTAGLVPLSAVIGLAERVMGAREKIEGKANFSLSVFHMLFGSLEE